MGSLRKGHFNLRGCRHEKKGRVGKAVQAPQKAVKLDPDNANAWKKLGMAYAESGWHEKAAALSRIEK